LFQGPSQWSPVFESVRRLLLYAREHGVTVVLFINPYHADYLLTLELAGRWQQFGAWKRQLARLADEFGVDLWDFSGINPLSAEQVPVAGDKETILEWFWEPAHYRVEYGDLMLGRMLRRSCDEGNVGLVGSALKAGNVDTRIRQSHTDLLRYKERHAPVIERLRALRFNKSQAVSSGH